MFFKNPGEKNDPEQSIFSNTQKFHNRARQLSTKAVLKLGHFTSLEISSI